MSTNALIHVRDGGQTICTIYKHLDGYPEGLGSDIASALGTAVITNGVQSGSDRFYANGIGCLAAKLVDVLKDGPGDVYIVTPDSDDMGEEYVYVIWAEKHRSYELGGEIKPQIRIIDVDEKSTVYEGPLDGLATHLANAA